MMRRSFGEGRSSGKLSSPLKPALHPNEGPTTNQPNNNKPRRRKRSKKKNTIAPDVRFAARDLYVSLRCDWKKGQPKRIVMVNWAGGVVFDKPVREWPAMRPKVADFIKGKVVIGHQIEYALHSLNLQHSWADLRDVAQYLPYMRETQDALSTMLLPRTLEDLAVDFLERDITSVNDHLIAQARAAMDLYRHKRVPWENEITVVLRQKETQYESLLETRLQENLQSIDETIAFTQDEHEYSPNQVPLPGSVLPTDFALPVNSESILLPEEKSLSAPTEATQETDTLPSASVRDDMSSVVSSEQSIWKPADASVENSDGSSTWGLWLQPTDATDDSTFAQVESRRKYTVSTIDEYSPEEDRLLPHHLLETFDESDHDDPPEETLAEPAPRRPSLFSRRRRSLEAGKGVNAGSFFEHKDWRGDLEDAPKRTLPGREETSHHIDGTDWLSEQPRNKSWLSRLMWAPSEGAEEASRTAERETWLNRSSHNTDSLDLWVGEGVAKESRFSFFRRKSPPRTRGGEASAEKPLEF